MKYKTDLHVHTSEGSCCSNCCAQKTVEKYLAAGYDSVVLTNHIVPESLQKMSFDAMIDHYMNAHQQMVDAAKGTSLSIILGVEIRFSENANHYLVYGLTETFLRSVPDFPLMKPDEYVEYCRREGLLFVQAHPLRHGLVLPNPAILDGVEVHNGHVGHESYNEVAHLWAKNNDLIPTSGSDHHNITQLPTGGILTQKKLTDANMVVDVLKSGEYILIEGVEAEKRRLQRKKEEEQIQA